jgi:hypothetical protein
MHLGMALIKVQGTSGIFHRRVLPFLDPQTQHLECQVAQGPGLGLSSRLRGPHQRRVPGCVSDHLVGMTQQQGLPEIHTSVRKSTAVVNARQRLPSRKILAAPLTRLLV